MCYLNTNSKMFLSRLSAITLRSDYHKPNARRSHLHTRRSHCIRSRGVSNQRRPRPRPCTTHLGTAVLVKTPSKASLQKLEKFWLHFPAVVESLSTNDKVWWILSYKNETYCNWNVRQIHRSSQRNHHIPNLTRCNHYPLQHLWDTWIHGTLETVNMILSWQVTLSWQALNNAWSSQIL